MGKLTAVVGLWCVFVLQGTPPSFYTRQSKKERAAYNRLIKKLRQREREKEREVKYDRYEDLAAPASVAMEGELAAYAFEHQQVIGAYQNTDLQNLPGQAQYILLNLASGQRRQS